MENQIQVLKQSELCGRQFTVYGTPQEPLFLANDLANYIDHSNITKMLASVDEDEKLTLPMVKSGQNRDMWFLTEDGLYEVLMQSRKPIAKQFKKGVKVILKEIRKNGGYMVAQPDETPEQIMARALVLAHDTINRAKAQMEASEKRVNQLQCQNERQAQLISDQDKQIEVRDKHLQQLRPAATFAHAVETSSSSILVGDLARIIKQNGVEIGQNRLFNWMRSNGYLINRSGESYNLPTQKALNQGLFEIKKTVITKPDGTSLVTTTPKVTGKGQIYFVNKFLYDEMNRKGAEFQAQIEQNRKEGKL